VSPAAQAAIIGGIAGGLVGGIFTLLGVVVGLFGERWVRRVGEVRCTVDKWYPQQTGPRPGGGATAQERRLQVTFLNRKEMPVIVWEMRVEFYKGGEPLEEWARPSVQFVDVPTGQSSPQDPVNLPPYVPVTRTISVTPVDTHQKLRALEEADRAEFVANLLGAEDKREELSPPWLPPPS
jgi:hypothetical protein